MGANFFIYFSSLRTYLVARNNSIDPSTKVHKHRSFIDETDIVKYNHVDMIGNPYDPLRRKVSPEIFIESSPDLGSDELHHPPKSYVMLICTDLLIFIKDLIGEFIDNLGD